MSSDQHLLGQFLELSIPTPDILESLAFYKALGFEELEIGDRFGESVAWQSSQAFVSAPGRDVDGVSNAGVVYVYPIPTLWPIIAIRSPNPVENGSFGDSIVVEPGRIYVSEPGAPGGGEIYMFEQCTLQVVKATTETQARRPEVLEGSDTTSQESTAGIPEGTPPSPTLTVTSSGVQDWSDQQVAAWLRDVLKFDDVADAVLAEGVDGAMVLEMDKDEWKELGTSGLKAAKIVSQVKKLV